MPNRRLTMLIGVVMVAGLAIWLFWLAGGAARVNDAAARTDARVRSDSAVQAHGDSTSYSDAGAPVDTSLGTAPYASTLPDVAPPDTTNAVPPEAAPKPDGSPDRALLPRPLADTSLTAVEGSLEDRRLVVPVKGVRPDQLVDTYTASRSEGRVHNAIDIIAPGGTPVVATATGTVVKLFNSDRGGITLYELDPDGRTIYYYAHLAGYAPGIEEGKVIRQGELIGYVGDTGNAGPGNTHLHFEITIVPSPDRYWSGTPVNPYPLLRKSR
jgi:peptidoglycan LD-endopeptidase LytH